MTSPRQRQFEILPGLPSYGALPFPYPKDGRGSHHEGFVIRFFPHEQQKESWVGNFQARGTGFSTVERHPDGNRLVVIAGGNGYIIDPDCPGDAEVIGVQYCETFSADGLLLLISGINIDGFLADGTRWSTRRIAWDGIRSVRLAQDGKTIQGEAWKYTEEWMPFEIDVQTGEARGGSYDGP